MDLCVYESIVNSLYSTISQDEHLLKNYTGLDFKNQMLVYILENYYKDEKLRDVLNNHMAETFLLGGSLCTWVEKMMKTITWGDLELINVISLMLKLKISILDFGGGTTNIVTLLFIFSFSQKTDVDTDDEMEQPDDRLKCDENRRGSKRQVSIVSNTIEHF